MKNIVVCCDGTGNEISENISNVLKLYRVLRKSGKTDPQQVVFYDPGVGTLARPNPWTKLKQDAVTVLGLATGYGLDDNVLKAYNFLINHYEDADDIFLFGFSRGAYTVRVLAGLIHKVGLLSPQQRNLADAALTAYKQASTAIVEQEDMGAVDSRPANDEEEPQAQPTSRDDQASQFARIVSARWPAIKFVGVWDTVASIIVPRPDRYYAFSLQKLAFTQLNPSVKVFRQAIAIDERRRMFRTRTMERAAGIHAQSFQRDKQRRAAGCPPGMVCGSARRHWGWLPGEREWSFEVSTALDDRRSSEARPRSQSADRESAGVGDWRKGSPFDYVAPDILRDPHQSMTKAWRSLEWVPKSDKYKEWSVRRSWLGCYIPDCEPRPIPTSAHIHEFVLNRMKAVRAYRPVNLPSSYQVIPMASGPTVRESF